MLTPKPLTTGRASSAQKRGPKRARYTYVPPPSSVAPRGNLTFGLFVFVVQQSEDDVPTDSIHPAFRRPRKKAPKVARLTRLPLLNLLRSLGVAPGPAPAPAPGGEPALLDLGADEASELSSESDSEKLMPPPCAVERVCVCTQGRQAYKFIYRGKWSHPLQTNHTQVGNEAGIYLAERSTTRAHTAQQRVTERQHTSVQQYYQAVRDNNKITPTFFVPQPVDPRSVSQTLRSWFASLRSPSAHSAEVKLGQRTSYQHVFASSYKLKTGTAAEERKNLARGAG